MSEQPRAAWATTLLFVPGTMPERFAKAAGSGADLVICDLEDAVRAGEKDYARSSVVGWLAADGRGAVRINAPGTEPHDADVAALRGVVGLEAVVVPMAEDPADLHWLVERLPGVPVLALIETAKGVRAAAEIAAVAGVVRVGVGHLDLAADLGCDPDDALIAHARHEILLAVRTADSPAPVDGVTPDVRDFDRVAADARRAAASGFGGKLCVHPAQVEQVKQAFRPAPDIVAWAQTVVTAVADGVGVVDGQMVDAPVLARAQAVLARAEGAS